MLLLVDVKKRFMLRSEKWLTGPNIRKEHRAGPMEGGGKGGGTGGAYELAVLPSWSPYGAYALGCAGAVLASVCADANKSYSSATAHSSTVI